MTIVIALKDPENKRVIMAADRRIISGQLIYKAHTKLFSLPLNIVDGYGEVIDTATIHIGFAGASFLDTFFKHGFTIPDMNSNQDFVEYLYKSFFPAMSNKLVDNYIGEVDSNQLNTWSEFIFVFHGEIYHIQYNFGVNISDDDFIVIGSGVQVATGSLYTNLKFHPEMNKVDMVKQAVISVGDNTIYCDSDVEVKIINYG